MSKKNKKQTIKVFFSDGKVDEIPQRLWDDYEYQRDSMFVVKRKGAWIAIYNMKCVDCIVVG